MLRENIYVALLFGGNTRYSLFTFGCMAQLWWASRLLPQVNVVAHCLEAKVSTIQIVVINSWIVLRAIHKCTRDNNRKGSYLDRELRCECRNEPDFARWTSSDKRWFNSSPRGRSSGRRYMFCTPEIQSTSQPRQNQRKSIIYRARGRSSSREHRTGLPGTDNKGRSDRKQWHTDHCGEKVALPEIGWDNIIDTSKGEPDKTCRKSEPGMWCLNCGLISWDCHGCLSF